jgi:hypothetical protein
MVRLLRWACAAAAVAAVAAACSSPSSPTSGTGTSKGTVEGTSLAVKDATFYEDFGSGGAFYDRVTVTVRDAPRACAATAATTQLVLYAQGDSVGTGTYALGTPDGGIASFNPVVARAVLQSLDAQCGSRVAMQDELATGGSFTIASKTDGVVTGSFDAVFPGGELSGSFEAQVYDCSTADAGTPANACP